MDACFSFPFFETHGRMCLTMRDETFFSLAVVMVKTKR
jgi:hypothetical protein